ncbi:hypothetical protein SDRG_10611 [Saprolegnia diclina VS20]|uniref:Uncharacterized protein n=1 Tax=Saprolegnia diclina (strain VS20) TaxID=1156394 RepID=T0RHN1_SAPDV|nr:hypothetical protein SDRG_10611 [Saprolegnia diclina VS20]EQC31823.1 hypothetical protein SDRG_10611 [Saprolegnia diclina VS20]|eukprot:XP_008614830.1 hypothetical protein SDRG_10611 [Saprolegnia diclina VS20]
MPFGTALRSPSGSERDFAAGAYEYEPELPRPSKRAPAKAPPLATSTTALITKIRKQAKELSELHEELATKDKLIEKLRSAKMSGQVIVQGERQRIKSKEAEADEWKLKFEREQKRCEAALRRIKDLKSTFNNTSSSPTTPAPYSPAKSVASSSEASDDPDQRNYIRILEDAVRIKADELNISGHAELLLVLAELRHTTSTQDEALKLKDARISELERLQSGPEAPNAKEQSDAIMDYAHSLSDKQKTMASHTAELSQQVTKLREDLAASQAELRKVADQYNALLTDYDATQAALAVASHARTAVEQTNKDNEARLAAFEAAADGQANTLHELKALQDELLQSISEAQTRERSAQQSLHDLRAELQSAIAAKDDTDRRSARLHESVAYLEQDNATLRDDVAALRQSYQTLQAAKTALQTELDEMRAFEASFGDLSAVRKGYADVTETARKLRTDLHTIDQFVSHAPRLDVSSSAGSHGSFLEWFLVGDLVGRVALLEQRRLPPPFLERLPKLAAYLHEIYNSVSNVVSHVAQMEASWAREKFNLVAARDAFDASATLMQNELGMMQTWNAQLHDDCQQKHRRLVEIEQRLSVADALVAETSARSNELQDQLNESQDALVQLRLQVETDATQKHVQEEELHCLREQVADMAERVAAASASTAAITRERDEARSALEQLRAALATAQCDVDEARAAHDALSATADRLRVEKIDLEASLGTLTSRLHEIEASLETTSATLHEKRGQLETTKTHVHSLQNAIWDMYIVLKPRLPALTPPPHDALEVVRSLPTAIDALVEAEVKASSTVALKQSLLQHCESVDYAEPSLSLVRELQRDLAQTQDENQTLKMQLSGARADAWGSHRPETPIVLAPAPEEDRRATVAASLRKKLTPHELQRLHAKPPPPTTKTPRLDSQALAEAYVLQSKNASLEEQLHRLHSAFASFRTDM